MSKGKFSCTACREDFDVACVNMRCPAGYHYAVSVGADVSETEDCDDPLETKMTESYELGIVGEKENMARRLFAMSGESYAARKDEVAKTIRAMAERFESEAEKARAEWTKKHHPERLKA